MGILDSLIDVCEDVATIVAAPVEIAVDLVSVPVKELADVAKTMVQDVKSIKD